MAVTILKKTQFNDFQNIEGLFNARGSYPADFTLVAGENYAVDWNGATYRCVAQDIGSLEPGCIAIGDVPAFARHLDVEVMPRQQITFGRGATIDGYECYGTVMNAGDYLPNEGDCFIVEINGEEFTCKTMIGENGLPYIGSKFPIVENSEYPFFVTIGYSEIDSQNILVIGLPANVSSADNILVEMRVVMSPGGSYEGSREPFLILSRTDFTAYVTYEGSEHEVAIYRYDSSKVQLKDHSSTIDIYENVSVVRLDTPDGGTKDFIACTPMRMNIDLNFVDEDEKLHDEIELIPGYEELYSYVKINRPQALIPENIAEGIIIAGIEGKCKSADSIKLEGDLLKYFVYQIDMPTYTISICGVKFDELYRDTGSYDIEIPDMFGDFHVEIDSMGV